MAALEKQEQTATTEPVPVAVDGHAGLYLELTAPADLSFATCDLGYFSYWEGSPDDAQHTVDSPGTVDRTWILDVAGDRVVVVAAAPPGVTAAQVREMTGDGGVDPLRRARRVGQRTTSVAVAPGVSGATRTR